MQRRTSTRAIISLLLSMVAALLFVGPANAATTGETLQNDVFWKDASGNPIYSQGGVLKVGSTYYWYGAKYNGAVTYPSTDLVHWKFEGNALTASDLGAVAGSAGSASCTIPTPEITC